MSKQLQLTFPVSEGSKFSDTVILPSNLVKFYKLYPQYEKYKPEIRYRINQMKEPFECDDFKLERVAVYNCK